MSNLVTFGAINEKVEKIFQEESLETKGLAFIKLCLKTLLKLNDDEIEEAITDGPMDGEIDAMYIANRVVHLMTFKYTDKFALSKKNYPESELDQFILTLSAVISGSLDRKTINEAVWEKYQEIRNLATTGKIEFKIYVVSNKLHPAPHAKLKLENAIDTFKVVEVPIYLDQEDLFGKILENKVQKVNGKVRFIHRHHFEKSDGNIKTVIGAISAKDLIDLIIDPKNNKAINEQVFNENVRNYKPNHRVNLAIIESAMSSNNYQFFYLNNGITILCDKVDYTPNTISPLAELTNFQIINGGQTSHSLFEVYKEHPEKLESIEVLIRVCQAQNDESNDPISQKISESSNNQIPVGSRDLHANDHIQKKLEEAFEDLGYYYERKPNMHADKPQGKVLNNELLGQLFMAYHLDMPSEAKNNKNKVFSDSYDAIFDEKIISAQEFLRLYKLYLPLLEQKKEIQKKKRRRLAVPEKEAFVSRATFHILSGVKLLFENEIAHLDSEDHTAAEKEKLRQQIYDAKGPTFTKRSIDYVFQVAKREMRLRGKDYTHDKFFKEIPTNSLVRTYILKKINSS